ncbi:MAG: hypothetical protein ABW019_00085, partial [Chitinophagaceae bacterium]
FNNKSYKPACSEYGTLTVLFPSDERRKFSGSASNSQKKYNWNFNFTPEAGGCVKKNLTID